MLKFSSYCVFCIFLTTFECSIIPVCTHEAVLVRTQELKLLGFASQPFSWLMNRCLKLLYTEAVNVCLHQLASYSFKSWHLCAWTRNPLYIWKNHTPALWPLLLTTNLLVWLSHNILGFLAQYCIYILNHLGMSQIFETFLFLLGHLEFCFHLYPTVPFRAVCLHPYKMYLNAITIQICSVHPSIFNFVICIHCACVIASMYLPNCDCGEQALAIEPWHLPIIWLVWWYNCTYLANRGYREPRSCTTCLTY